MSDGPKPLRDGSAGTPEQHLTLTTRLRWAIVGVALLVVPISALTVSYLAGIYAYSQEQVRQLGFATEMEALWRDLSPQVSRAVDGLDAGSKPGAMARLDSFEEGLVGLVERFPMSRQALVRVATQGEGLREALIRIAEARARASDAESKARGASVVGGALSSLGEVSANAARAAWVSAARSRIGALDSAIFEVRRSALSASETAAGALEDKVDAANRNLVTLAMLTLVYLGALFIFLPSRLLSSFSRIRASLRQAQSGDLTVRAPVEGSDDVTVLAREFNQMMEVLEKFDVRKKDRIYQDAQQIRILGEHSRLSVALVGLDLRLSSMNRRFCELFGIEHPIRGQLLHLSEVCGGGTKELADLLEESVRRRRLVRAHPIEIQDAGGTPRKLTLALEPVRSADARLTHFLLVFDPVEGEASSTSYPQTASNRTIVADQHG